jgi:predicted TIM-barrel fold metal-dependent hydrolase
MSQTPAASGRVDIHRHVSPPFYQDRTEGIYPKAFPPLLAAWTPERCLADMDAGGIELGVLSMPARPGVYFGDVAGSRTFCRETNEYMAGLRRKHPGRFGMFAALPLPDIEGSIAELAYAFDVLKAEGVGTSTNYENKYLGDPLFAPLWSELDRRGAIVFTHPTDAQCCPNPVPQMTETVVEFGADTARTIGSLLFSGTATRFPRIRFVFSHGGGSMPFAIDRFLNQSRLPNTAALLPNGLEYELRRFYYDTAFASSPVAMAALTKLVPSSQIVLGTDFPYSSGATTIAALNTSGVASSDIAAILRENGLALLRGPARTV